MHVGTRKWLRKVLFVVAGKMPQQLLLVNHTHMVSLLSLVNYDNLIGLGCSGVARNCLRGLFAPYEQANETLRGKTCSDKVSKPLSFRVTLSVL